MSASRRDFLNGLLRGASVVAAASCATPTPTGPPPPEPPAPAPPGLPYGLDPRHFHVHKPAPLGLEVRRSALGAAAITPIDRFFVRNNLPRPSDDIVADRGAWALEVDGVARPGSITLRHLAQLGLESVATVIQCSGNGRRFFEHGPSGSQWATGAAGCALWTGVRVADVLRHFGGPVQGARFLTGTGGEPLPEGVDRDTVVVERSVPIEKGLRDCLLVWEMNGEPLPITHGGPLRLVVPGYFGVNQIKYVRRLAATAAESTAEIQRKGYRLRPIGEKGSPEQPTMWRMPVKSWINGPGADDQPVLTGPVRFFGVALSGERGVVRVEVSLDGGRSWSDAELVGPDLGPDAWRTFRFTAELPPGQHTVASRATDAAGDVQPELRTPNERGYRHTGWRDHALSVRVVERVEDLVGWEPAPDGPASPPSARGPVTLSEAGQRGKALFQELATPPCATCHTLGDAGAVGAVGPNLDQLAPDAARVAAAVTNGVGTMPPFESLSPEQIADLAAYVSEATGH